jgi:hypothetical protein
MKQLVITVHGIRTFGHWQERLEQLLYNNTPDQQPTVINYKYGYFSVVAFLIPFLRWLIVRRFRHFLVSAVESQTWDRIDIVAHSFGTHIACWALYKIKESTRPRVNTLILARSVLKSNFPWQRLLGHGVQRLVNDCGVKDSVLVLNQVTVLFTGMAGRLGFNGGTGRAFRNRFFDFGHSGYFLTAGQLDDAFMKKFWIPLLSTNAEPELVDERQASAFNGLYTTILNNLEPIKLTIYMSPVILFALFITGLYFEAEVQRTEAERQRRMSEARRIIAEQQRAEAEKQRRVADEQRKEAIEQRNFAISR